MNAHNQPTAPAQSLSISLLQGALFAVIFSFPAALLLTTVYRFPIPFVGYASGGGIEGITTVILAVFIYGNAGGFEVLAVGGAVAGAVAHRLGNNDRRRIRKLTIWLSIAVAFVACFVLSILDKIIGPW